MRRIAELLEQEGFLKILFQSIPCGVLIVNHDRRIQAVNHVLERTFGVSEAEVIDKRGGEALGCIHSFKSPLGCGYSDHCHNCQVRNTALKALTGTRVHRCRSEVQLTIDDQVKDLVLLASAAPLEYQQEQLAIVLLEDITELNRLQQRLKTEQCFAGIVGRDKKMLELFDTIREVAEANAPVLIEGESGTGKELVAAAIHNEGPRASKQFVPVNCGALPEGLLESELFGHVRGAFTGALRDKRGRFEMADGGTIFLDEIGDLSPAIQVKLLRVLQEGTFERVGDEKSIKVDVRVISATNKALRKEVAARRFREDLFFRICVVPITMPSLRERRNDIPLLAGHFLERNAKESGLEKASLSDSALSLLMSYEWPGNVRELQNSLQFALIKCKGQVIEAEHLPPTLSLEAGISPARKRRKRKLKSSDVENALRKADGNKERAAEILSVSRATLYRFIKEQEEKYK